MKPFSSTTPAVASLMKVARLGMSHVDFGVVKETALYVWYGSDVPDLSNVTGPHKKDLLFLVERLAYYNVVPQTKKKALLSEVRKAGGRFEDMENTQLESLFKSFLPMLQPMQTRHFKEQLAA